MGYNHNEKLVVIDITTSNKKRLISLFDEISNYSNNIELVTPLNSDVSGLVSKVKRYTLSDKKVAEWTTTVTGPTTDDEFAHMYILNCHKEVIDVLKSYKVEFASSIIDTNSEFDVTFKNDEEIILSFCPHNKICIYNTIIEHLIKKK